MDNFSNISSFFGRLIYYAQTWYAGLSEFAEKVIYWLFTPLKVIGEKIPQNGFSILDDFIKLVTRYTAIGNITIFEVMCGSLIGLYLGLVVTKFLLSLF